MKKLLAIVLVLTLVFALAVPSLAATSNTNGRDSSGGGVPSPATGDNTVLWCILGAAMLLGAGVCFTLARGKLRA